MQPSITHPAPPMRRTICFRILPGAALAAAALFTAACERAPALGKPFATPEEAAASLVAAAERYDLASLREILGPAGEDIIASEDAVQDSSTLAAFAAEARRGLRLDRDSTGATVVVGIGPDDWPLPIPLVEVGGQWRFNTEEGREEILHRRVGRNELDAIQVCLGYVEAQREYALVKHDGALVNQYAQRIISTPGKRDGLAWRTEDGTWEGPVSQGIADAIADGYTSRTQPFHGYYFKVLTGQGPAAPIGEVDFMVQGAMIGGFALVAAPADYRVTGINTFIVSHDGIVYEKDLGEETLEAFRAMERYNPDSTWTEVSDAGG
jgi:Protein of unknown function (DUF2950)